jgi:hypothetical protein
MDIDSQRSELQDLPTSQKVLLSRLEKKETIEFNNGEVNQIENPSNIPTIGNQSDFCPIDISEKKLKIGFIVFKFKNGMDLVSKKMQSIFI